MKNRIQIMNCPVCGKPATEYDINKWKCLECHTKFIYEPPTVPIVDAVLQKINIENLEKDSLVFKCPWCKIHYSYVTNPIQECRICNNSCLTCLKCFNSPKEMKKEKNGLSLNVYNLPPKICESCLNKIMCFIFAQRFVKREKTVRTFLDRFLGINENSISMSFYYNYISRGQYYETHGLYTSKTTLSRVDKVLKEMNVC